MGRPDFQLMGRQQRAIADSVGETATWLSFVSAGAVGAAAEMYGEYAANSYRARTITALMQAPTMPENLMPGGVIVAGDVMATIIDAIPSAQDRIQWRGVTYRVESDPFPQQLLGRSAHRFILRRGDSTG